MDEMVDRHIRALFSIAFVLCCNFASIARAIEFKVIEDQMIVTGKIVNNSGDGWKFKRGIANNPQITTVVLRNMPGGDVVEMEQMRSAILDRKLNTVVSGSCESACATIFMAGENRNFSNDFPPQYAFLGFHGIYASSGGLSGFARAPVTNEDLWYVRRSSNKLDRELVQRWMTLGWKGGMAKFYASKGNRTSSSYVCVTSMPIDQCEKLDKSALEYGLITSSDLISVKDHIFPVGEPPYWEPSQYAKVASIEALLKTKNLSDGWKKILTEYMGKTDSKALAVGIDGIGIQSVASKDGVIPAIWKAVADCQERFKKKCQVIAVDDHLSFSADDIRKHKFN